MAIEWQQWSRELTEVLGLKRAPVAVTYTDTPPAGASTGKCRVCSALSRASKGTITDLSADNSSCAGGSLYLGLREQSPDQARTLREFLIQGEKLLSSPAAIYRSRAMAKVQPPFGLADHVIFSPLDKAELRPDVVVFICNAQQAARLVNLAYFETGLPMECDPTGALCRSVITYPLVTGKVNISFGDITARRGEKMADDELLITFPFVHLRSVVASVPKCTAGTAQGEIPPAMRRLMHQSGGEPPEL
jgi:uncharacterized protein (DUF169 family)